MDQRGKYQSRTELEMRVYHRLIHIRDQRERHDDIPPHILNNAVFKLTTQFREHVQKQSAPISKTSKLVVGAEGMEIFGQLASVLMQEGNIIMAYLVACILERLFGKETIEDIESIRGNLSIPEIIDGMVQSRPVQPTKPTPTAHIEEVGDVMEDDGDYYEDEGEGEYYEEEQVEEQAPFAPQPVKAAASGWFGANPSQAPLLSAPAPTATSALPTVSNSIPPPPSVAKSAFANLVSVPNAFGNNTNVFGGSPFQVSNPPSAFGNGLVFGHPTPTPQPQPQPAASPPAAPPPAAVQAATVAPNTSNQKQTNGASSSSSAFPSTFFNSRFGCPFMCGRSMTFVNVFKSLNTTCASAKLFQPLNIPS